MKTNGVIKKGIVLGILLVFIGAGAVSASTIIQSMSIQPTNRGNTLYVGGSGPGNYSTIQDAIERASNGDTIFVYSRSSPYHENLKVNKSLTLTGEKETMPVIEGSGLGDVVTFSGDARSARMSYFVIQHSDTSGIFIGFNLSDVTISNTIIQNCQFGVHCWHTTSAIITKNIIRNNQWGILFELTDNSQISYNHIENNTKIGIVIDSSPANKVYSNEIRDDNVGIIPVRSLQNEIYHNNFIDNQKTQATWKNSKSKWHDNYWNDISQHLIKKIYFIPGILRSEALEKQIFWIQLDTTPHQMPWPIP
jgi:parallel beta-helix repeat protein